MGVAFAFMTLSIWLCRSVVLLWRGLDHSEASFRAFFEMSSSLLYGFSGVEARCVRLARGHARADRHDATAHQEGAPAGAIATPAGQRAKAAWTGVPGCWRPRILSTFEEQGFPETFRLPFAPWRCLRHRGGSRGDAQHWEGWCGRGRGGQEDLEVGLLQVRLARHRCPSEGLPGCSAVIAHRRK